MLLLAVCLRLARAAARRLSIASFCSGVSAGGEAAATGSEGGGAAAEAGAGVAVADGTDAAAAAAAAAAAIAIHPFFSIGAAVVCCASSSASISSRCLAVITTEVGRQRGQVTLAPRGKEPWHTERHEVHTAVGTRNTEDEEDFEGGALPAEEATTGADDAAAVFDSAACEEDDAAG